MYTEVLKACALTFHQVNMLIAWKSLRYASQEVCPLCDISASYGDWNIRQKRIRSLSLFS